jgi:CRP-like cAMP-binding protein
MKSPEFLQKANSSFELAIYSAGDVIITEGSHEHRIYWIVSGSCKCVKKIPFIQKKNSPNKELHKYDVGAPLGPNDELVEHVFDIQELDPTDHFPGLPPDTTRIKEIAQMDQERGDLIMKGFLGDKEVDPSIAEYSVIATARTEIASLLKSDYIKFATEQMIHETLQQKNLFNVSVKEVQQTFLDQLNWMTYKKNLVDGIRKK